MSDLADAAGASEREPDARMPRFMRLVFEFAFLFGVTFAIQQTLGAALSGYPDLMWVPVVLLTLHKGLAAGLAATVIAAGFHFGTGIPPAVLGEDLYAYIRRISAEPVVWACFALIVGHVRSRQVAHMRELREQLAERGRHSEAVADLCVSLRRRIENLERQIAANAQSSNVEVAEALSELNHAAWDDFAPSLTRFVTIITGVSDFSVYLLTDNKLALAFRRGESQASPFPDAISGENALFSAVVNDRRILCAARVADRELLTYGCTVAGPLIQNPGSAIVGMLALGDMSPEHEPVEIERRFSVVAGELSRQVGRIRLIEKWQHAIASKGNGHGHDAREPQAADLHEPTVSEGKGSGRGSKSTQESAPIHSRAKSRRSITLQ